MRVLFLSPGLGIGGSERLTLRYAEAMLARGHQAGVAHGVERGVANDLVGPAREAGTEVFQISGKPLDYATLPGWAAGVRRAIDRFEPTVLHAQSVTTAAAARLAAPRTPLLVTVHGLERADRERLAAVVLSGLRATLSAVSEQAATNIGRFWPHPAIEVLPTGIDLGELERSAASVDVERFGSPAFCCVARQEPIKGVDVLLEAFALAHARIPSAGLTLVGSGSALEANRSLAERLDVSNVVRFTGSVPRAEPYVAASDVAVLPSRREGLPVAALEALGLGRPVVAAAVGGTPTVVRDGETGWLVAPEDPPALAEALVAAGSEPDEARRRGDAGRDLLRREYPPEAIFDRLEALFEAADTGTEVPALKPKPYYRAGRALHGVRARVASLAEAPAWTGLRILGYHRVSDEDDVLAVTVDQFRRQLDLVAGSGAEVVSLEEGTERLATGDDQPRVAITFDDGFRDTATNAAPVLREHGFTASVYLPTAVIDGEASYSWYRQDPPPALNWAEVRDLAAEGMLRFESHSRTHPALPRLERDQAAEEILRPKAEIEARTGRPVTSFCYPAGLYGQREAKLVAEAGYRCAVTTRAGVNGPGTDLMQLSRTMVGWRDNTALFEAKLRGSLDRAPAVTEWLQQRRAR